MSRMSTSPHLIQRHLSNPSVRPSAQQELPVWLLKVPGVSRIVERLGATEFRRRLFHMSPALLPIARPWIPHPDVWGPILIGVVSTMIITVLMMAILFAEMLKRKGETNWTQAVLGYVIPVGIALILFPGRSELGLMTLQILALGDGSATLGGMMIGGRRLAWNRRKTVSGLICFAVVGSLAATYSFWGEARPGIPILSAFLICGTSALCAGLVESLPIKSNDNLRVGMTALLVGITMSAMVQ